MTSDACATFIADSAWGQSLSPADLRQVMAATEQRSFAKHEVVARAGAPARHWVGIIRGIVAQSLAHADGEMTLLSAVGNGAWFGEGTLIKHDPWGYDAIALRESSVALVPLETFEWLRASSLPFNHFLEHLLNERLSTFVGLLASARHASTEARVANALSNLFNPALYRRRDRFVPLSQSDLALLAGVSRPRANLALRRLSELGIVAAGRVGITVLDLERLRAFASEN